ncbi:MAG: hypothetical protein GX675_02345 [Erysipelotrichaceae bacterium]|nr:hypothetical protein [Erysipelotrichaceae bacterium]
MTRKKSTKKRTNKKRSVNKANVILVVGLIIIALPFLIIGWIVISASLDTGTPILGERYKGDLDPAITKSDITSIESKIKSIDGVEKSSVELATATLRVYADVEDGYTAEQAEQKANEVFDSVLSVLDLNTYFSQTETKKMYDLEIHVYNLSKNRDSDDFVYVIMTKTSGMDTASTQLVSEPIDAELAQQLRDDVENRNNPKPTADDDGDMTVGTDEIEATEESTEGSEDTE